MSGRSRYADRYDELRRVGTDSYFLNIANGQCGDVAVSCWPTPEGVQGGRIWGKLGAMDIAIMPFRTRAETTSPTATLETFELELFLCEPDPQGFGPTAFPEVCHRQQCRSHTAISLVNLPAPVHVSQCLTTGSPNDTIPKKPWRFKSKEIQNCDGLARAARWTWDANGHESVVLHGGVAFKHVEKPFVVACRVRGKAFAELPTQRGRIRYQFSNEENTPKWWTMTPQKSSEDLSFSVQNLEALMQSLNTNSKSHVTSSAPTVPEASRSQSHNFAGSTISGSAPVVMGDVHFGHNPNTFQPEGRSQQLNTVSQMMSRMVSQMIE